MTRGKKSEDRSPSSRGAVIKTTFRCRKALAFGRLELRWVALMSCACDDLLARLHETGPYLQACPANRGCTESG